MQNADSALQAVPEAAFTQEASLRQQPQDRGRPPADGEEVAHRQVKIETKCPKVQSDVVILFGQSKDVEFNV